MNSNEEKVLVARLVISQFNDGSISVDGPIGHKEASLGLLSQARNAIENHHAKMASNGINRIINFVRGGKK